MSTAQSAPCLSIPCFSGSTTPNFGTRWRTQSGVAFDESRGLQSFHISHFWDSVDTLTANGIERAAPGSCLISAPGEPIWHRGAVNGFFVDWTCFSGPSAAATLRRYDLPSGVLLAVPPGEVTGIFESIRIEQVRRQPFWEQAVAGELERLLRLLARARHNARANDGQPEAIRLANVRAIVSSQLQRRWTVATMARLAGMSRSRFAETYRSAFGTSPMEDVAAARMECARRLLATSSLPIKSVACEIGLSPEHFARAFRTSHSLTPAEYRSRECTTRARVTPGPKGLTGRPGVQLPLAGCMATR